MTARRFLFATWDGGGNLPPQLSIARALLERGHDVRVIADPVLASEVRAAGAEHVAWTRGPHRTTHHPTTSSWRTGRCAARARPSRPCGTS